MMGENIGTTINSNMVALTASIYARHAVMAHLVFNLFCVIWMLSFFPYFVSLICEFVGVYALGEVDNANLITVVLAVFHTVFNI